MYSSLINSINFVKSFKKSQSAKYNFIKTTYSTGSAKHLYSLILFLLIAGSNTAKVQKVLTKSNSFKQDAKILLQLLYSNIFFARSYIRFMSIEIIICQTRK